MLIQESAESRLLSFFGQDASTATMQKVNMEKRLFIFKFIYERNAVSIKLLGISPVWMIFALTLSNKLASHQPCSSSPLDIIPSRSPCLNDISPSSAPS